LLIMEMDLNVPEFGSLSLKKRSLGKVMGKDCCLVGNCYVVQEVIWLELPEGRTVDVFLQ
jgi:hypothetical protein